MKTEYSLKEVNVMLDDLRFYVNNIKMNLEELNNDLYVNQIIRIERHIWKLQERLNGLDKAKEYNINPS